MKKEIRIFFTAMMFLTRLPVPKYTDHSQEYLEKSARYFPLIGWMVAGISWLTYVVLNKYIGEDIAIVGSIIAGILTTGAFHEDGFADCCDAFGGGWTKEKILTIMKDSRLGTFGVVGLISILSVKFLLLRELPKFTPSLENPSINVFVNYGNFLLMLLAAHGASRLMGVYTIRFYEYVTDIDASKAKPITSKKPGIGTLAVATLFALAPFALLDIRLLISVIPMAIAAWQANVYFKKWIGGYTGDCLGAIQQIAEIVFYLSAIIILRYWI
ncbi:MAG: adenosylcobinamide-GDP ribazoletransferase [Pseudobacter sp.]|uniref:adenosylcobinamide-GDP ribazoletransferase n=1 Tax=Pseudobacter sp. TaxID=2045420 RepID=UPI003F7FF182